ncbi:hypothetical protein E2L06_17650 [Haloterrigena sp. H1]|uniref:hypothetical protein n=1 Tax=Haloterrigena sp. H1 TaxID=2552943 RepID=UPI00110F1D81|nr:hypothetical protein [Haloterrigena sp. H1]TMT81736.1 hypothetical protein E2L06_17650 [Haloterrigena sp. H1]
MNLGLGQIGTLFGLFLSFFGSTLLAVTGTNWYQEQIERQVRRGFGYKATFGVELIEDGSNLKSGDRGSNQLTWYLTKPAIIHLLGLPIDSKDEIQEITKTKSTEWDDYVSIVDGKGIEYENVTTTSEIRRRIEEEINQRLEEYQDKVTRYSGEVLALGFLIQLISYLIQHFTAI